MVAVPVMNREQLPLGRLEFPSAAGADQSVNGQRPLPVAFPNREGLL